MAFVSRRVILAVVLLVAVMAAAANAACDSNCATCALDYCVTCKSGYYLTASGCTSCGAAHCAHCEAVGWCISCEPGYKLQYVTDSTSISVNKYGTCVNGASVITATTALMATAAALVYAIVA